MTDLSARVEGLSGPDRDVDADIAARLCGGPVDVCVAPAYTRSIDAAMTLVPEGCEGLRLALQIDSWYRGNGMWLNTAKLWDGLSPSSSWKSSSATIALALCASALKARGL